MRSSAFACDADATGNSDTQWHIFGDVQVEQRPREQQFSDVVASDWQPLALRCAISHERLTDPAKGESCTHPPCCNFEPFKGAVARLSREKKCPVGGCGVRMSRARDIVRDVTLAEKLRSVPPDVSTVWTRGDEMRWEDPESAARGSSSSKRMRAEIVDVELEDGKTLVVDEQRRLYWVREVHRRMKQE